MKYRSAAVAALVMLAGACGGTNPASPQSEPAAPQAVEPLATPSEAPPTVNGFYEYGGICPGEGGCPSTRWRAAAPIQVYQRTDATSPIVATLAPGDWVDALDGVTRIVPTRGVVRAADQGLEAGDVVYMLDAHGEGEFTLWRRGEYLSWSAPASREREADIQWDPVAPHGPTLGWWVNVRLADGKAGWVLNPRDFSCMDARPDDAVPC